MFCPNCGTQVGEVNFCPNCGAKIIAVTPPTAATGQENRVMLQDLGTCSRGTAAALLQQICGYAQDEALLIVDSLPITVARGLNDAQARLLAQAFAEYGMEVSVYDGNGWRELESANTSVWDQTGALLAGVASALGLLSLNNRISRDMMHRGNYPYRFAGPRPPAYRLNSALRAVPPRHVAPVSVRPPVHHAPPPPIRHAPPPPRPTPPPPPRPAPPPPRPASRPAPTAAPRPAPGPARPAGPGPRPGGMPGGGGRPGGGRPGSGGGRRG